MAKLKKFKKKVGSRRQVWNRTAKQTPGGLKRKDLYKDKYGSLQSRKSMKKSMKKKRKYSKKSRKSRKSKKSRRYRRRSQKGGDNDAFDTFNASAQKTAQDTLSGYVLPSAVRGTLSDAEVRAAPNPDSSGSNPAVEPDAVVTGASNLSALLASSPTTDAATGKSQYILANYPELTTTSLPPGYAGFQEMTQDDMDAAGPGHPEPHSR